MNHNLLIIHLILAAPFLTAKQVCEVLSTLKDPDIAEVRDELLTLSQGEPLPEEAVETLRSFIKQEEGAVL